MREYVYRCSCGREIVVPHSVDANPEVRCPDCHGVMWRKPQIPLVNWGGLKPSQGSIHPNIQRLIDDAPRRREEIQHDQS